jgi:hypothetical protein
LKIAPGDQLYEILGSLTIAVQRLDQTLGQLARWADDPKLATHLHRAAAHVRDAAVDLNLAWSASSTLPRPEPDGSRSVGGPEIGGVLRPRRALDRVGPTWPSAASRPSPSS